MTKTIIDYDNIIVAKNLTNLRLANRLSQNEMATIIGVSSKQVNRYESGKNKISASKLLKIANTLNIPMNAFYVKPDSISFDDILSDETTYLIMAKIFVQIPQVQQDALLALAKTMLPKQNKMAGESK